MALPTILARRAWCAPALGVVLGVLCFAPMPAVAQISSVGAAAPTPRVAAVAALDRGRRVFEARCYYCHGYAGDAATTAAAYLRPRPRDFTRLDVRALDRIAMRRSVASGRTGTAMPAFGGVLSAVEIEAVVDYVADVLARGGERRPRYHGTAAGWGAAFPTSGDVPGGAPAKRDPLCLTCHEAADADGGRPTLDVVSGASPYAAHDVAPTLGADVSPTVRAGERVFQENCAFCHARDGSGRNWIGSFLEPHARDLRSAAVCNARTLARLPTIVTEGLPGTSMPAWGAVLGNTEIEAVSAYVRAAFCSDRPGAPPADAVRGDPGRR